MNEELSIQHAHDRIDELKRSMVSWTIFSWAIGIILIIFGWSLNAVAQATAKAEAAITRVSSVEGDIKGIDVSLTSINNSLSDIRDTLKGR